MADKEPLPRNADGDYKLGGRLDLDTVADFKARGVLALGASKDVVRFDMAEAEVRGSAVIALLVALQREAERQDKKIEFVNCPETLLDIADACGVGDILKCGVGHGS